jgi:hypothetical protein
MEELDSLPGFDVNRALARAFPQRTRRACEREIILLGFATAGFRNDMVDVKGRFLTGLRELAILASIVRSPNDEPSQCERN